MVNIHEPGPLEGRLTHWPVLAASGALEVRLAETDHEVEAAQRLRYHVFYEEMSAVPSDEMREQGRDFDRFDEVCDHLLVVDRSRFDDDGQPMVVGTYRLMRDVDAARVGGFYTANEYDLAPMLRGFEGARLLELGRSCVMKEYRTKPGAMQLLWRGVVVYNTRFSIDVMFGCPSFAGTDPQALALPLSYLRHFHLAPPSLRVRANPARYVDMNLMAKEAIDPKEALRALPPLLKGYVRAGAWVGDGAVIDWQFSTTDVFICFPMSNIDERYRSRFEMKQ
ncbi:MAG TPA: GNAT family N-acyltransferase [Rhizomicrobium sp.]|nr:GNAT family N-acyltransferase [Rhizomicrobium sp.]